MEREILIARREALQSLLLDRAEAEALRTWRMIQAARIVERRRPLLSTNFLK